MKKRLLLAGVLVVAGVAAILITRFNNRHDDGVLLVSGNVEVTEVNTGFKVPGRVIELLAEEGDRVQKGRRLAVLDSAELESQVAQQRAFLGETKARLAELKAGSRPQELGQAEAHVRSAEAELAKARKDYDRAELLYKNGAVSAQQMDAATKALDVAASLHRKAVEAMSLVREGPRKEEVAAAENRVQQAEAALRTSQERLKDTVIDAPAAGGVLRRNVEAGETVTPAVPVYTIGDLENPWIKVYIKEDKLGRVKLGQKAEVTTDSYPGRRYEGTVTYLSSEAEFTPKNVQTQEERVKLVFGVKVSVKNVSGELKPGMPADVRIAIR